MARRLSFPVAQPITIGAWYLASLLLLTLAVLASTIIRLPSPPHRALTQAFYYGIMAGVLYFLIASMMVVTVFGASRGHYPREFKLTMSQRTLMLQTITFLIYLLSGSAVFAHIEKWQFLDAVYWADFTLLTVGIGDYAPKTHMGRALLFPYAIGGIVMLGLVIGSVRSLVLEKGKHKMGARMVEKERVRLLARLNHGHGKAGGKDVLVPTSSTYGRGKEGSPPPSSETSSKEERQRRREEFELMRKVQVRAAKVRRWTSLYISLLAWFTLWFLGALVFMYAERGQKWSYFQALYFAYTSLLTIGYGDLTPMSNSGKPFFVFWSLLAVPTMTVLISNMGDTIVKGIRDATLWLGEVTVLPGEHPTTVVLKRGAAKLTRGRIGLNPKGGSSNADTSEEENDTGVSALPPGILGDQSRSTGERGVVHHIDVEGIDRVAGQERAVAELDSEDAARRRGDISDADRHRYAFVLMKEIRRVMEHLSESPPRQYNFEEWAWFLRLLGEDESASGRHREAKPSDQARRQSFDKVKGRGKWSWLGKRSPLMGSKSESEWVLERLSGRLEAELERREREEGDECEKVKDQENDGDARVGRGDEVEEEASR